MKKIKLNVVTRTVIMDLQTPVGIYLKMRDIYSESALLESSDFHGRENSYSFIGLVPMARLRVEESELTKHYPDGTILRESIGKGEGETVVERFEGFLAEFDVQGENPTGINGLFGYMAYDSVSYFETVETKNAVRENGTVPDMYYIFYRFVLVIDHLKNQLTIVESIPEGESSRLAEMEAALKSNNVGYYDFETVGQESSTITDQEYMEMVSQGVEHCRRGDVFQIVLSRCYRMGFAGDDFKVYRALRSINPSPYLFYFDFGSFRIFGSSPETHCKVGGGRAQIDPIAGTYRRTGNDDRDRELAEELLRDEKENAEHVMLVDLARNDLSRNCSDVKVDFYKNVQYYSHVIHLVSRVSGQVEPGIGSLRVLADTFPAGTLSGAPKVRAMQLIRDIEPHTRGIYGGCIGYVGLNGDVNQAITIRSFLSKSNVLYYQAGAGVVSKSDPRSELSEVGNKLGALKKAVDMAVTMKN